MPDEVVTRFAPSPTGSVHLGNARTAFFSFLWARKAGGRFILRMEDTDQVRSEDRYRAQLFEDLHWLGLDWDEGPDIGGPRGPYDQSERTLIYARLFSKLEASDRCYPCYCTDAELELARKLQRMAGKPPRYAGTCRDLGATERAERAARGLLPTLRFRVEEGKVIDFVDLVHGPQRFNSSDIGDFIVRRQDGTAPFFFSNAVDDSLMGVTHVLRGDDHLANTPRQLMLLEALDLRTPRYGHVGLLMGADGTPLSKRHGSASVRDFRNSGYLPEALLNQLFHLGHVSDVEHWLALREMPAHFFPERLGRAPARLDESQLVHWQKQALQHLPADEMGAWLAPVLPSFTDESTRAAFIELVRHNIVLPDDAKPWAAALEGELPELPSDSRRILEEAGKPFFASALSAYDESGGNWSALTRLLKERSGKSGAKLFMPLRLALTGMTHGPELAPLLKLMPPPIARARLKAHA